jgi:3-oxoisoapionate decarboxylase
MQLGISSYTYTWAIGVPGSPPEKPLSAFGLIDKAFSCGLRLVQIADNLPLENLSDQELTNLIEYSAAKAIRIEAGSRGLTPEHTMDCLRVAEKLQSPILRMVIDRPGYEPDLKNVIGIISDLVPEFRSRKIRLAIENHDRFKAREFEHIIQSVGSEWVGICLDSVNSMGAGEGFDEVSRILIPYTINLHVKDFSIRRVDHKMGIIIEGTPAGRGRLNIGELVSALSGKDQCGSAILELWTPPEKEIQDTIVKEDNWALESIKFLKPLFHG